MAELIALGLLGLFLFVSAFAHFSDSVHSLALREVLGGESFLLNNRKEEAVRQGVFCPGKDPQSRLIYNVIKNCRHSRNEAKATPRPLSFSLTLSDSVICESFANPWTAARQAPLSMAFSRQEYWSG